MLVDVAMADRGHKLKRGRNGRELRRELEEGQPRASRVDGARGALNDDAPEDEALRRKD